MAEQTERNVFVPRNNKAVQDLEKLNRLTFTDKGHTKSHMDEAISYLTKYEIVDPDDEFAYEDAYILASYARVINGLEPFYNTPRILAVDLDAVAQDAPQTLERLNKWNNQTYLDRRTKNTEITDEFKKNLESLSQKQFAPIEERKNQPKP